MSALPPLGQIREGTTDPEPLPEWPGVTVVVVTLNAAGHLEACLRSVLAQSYPQEKIEILVVDGGSEDGTPHLASLLGARVISRPTLRHDAEARRAVGLREARGELILSVDADNLLPTSSLLRNLVFPLLHDQEIVGSQTAWFLPRRSDSSLQRYLALLGGTDPVGYYIGAQDRFEWGSLCFPNNSRPPPFMDMGPYLKVSLSETQVLSFGANGFLARRAALLEVSQLPIEAFSHVDAVYDLVRRGHNRIAIVKDSIVHLPGGDLVGLLKRRVIYMQRYTLKSKFRRSPLLGKGGHLKLLIATASCLSPAKTGADAISGFRRTGDAAWFIHVFYSPMITLAYAWAVMAHRLGRGRPKGSL